VQFLAFLEAPLQLEARRDVVDHGKQQRAAVDLDRTAIHLDLAHLARSEAVGKDEVEALFATRPRHLRLDLVRRQAVDVADAHGEQGVARMAVILDRGPVGIDDAAVRRIDQQLHRGIGLEETAVASLALGQGLLARGDAQQQRGDARREQEHDGGADGIALALVADGRLHRIEHCRLADADVHHQRIGIESAPGIGTLLPVEGGGDTESAARGRPGADEGPLRGHRLAQGVGQIAAA
jgi:hypothetical protein